MAEPRFLQIHTLHSYPIALLNRDASGLAKRIRYGDAVRTRISSQCLKWHWRGKTRRTEDGMEYEYREYALNKIDGAILADRTRNVIDRRVMQPIRDAGGIDPDVLTAIEEAFQIGVYGDRGTNRDARQPLLLGLPEIEFLQKKATDICGANPQDAEAARADANVFFGTNRNNFNAMREQLSLDIPKGKHGGLEGALFGRMVTSDPGANIEASVHVAHAFTVHAEESESDYFSVVDDLQREDEDAGAAHIGDMELTAGLFYGYVVVDLPGLVSNLQGCKAEEWLTEDRELAAQVIHNLLHLIATVSPGAKLGSTAPYGRARFMLVEAGSGQPYSLADAFRKPTKAQLEDVLERLQTEIACQDENYGRKGVRRYMSMQDCNLAGGEKVSLDDLAQWTAGVVRAGEALTGEEG